MNNIMREKALALAPDIDEGVIDAGIELASYFSSHDLADFRKHFGGDRFDSLRVNNNIPGDVTLHDKESGLYIKSYASRGHAALQYATMNTLRQVLSTKEAGITAVRHLALATDGERSVAAIEPANGQQVWSKYRDYPGEKRAVAWRAYRRLQWGIGTFTTRVLANDIMRPGNVGGNVFEDDEGNFELIDQPADTLSFRIARVALRRQGWGESLSDVKRDECSTG